MCGVAGVISLKGPLSQPVISEFKSLTGLIKHRGPDQQGYFETNNTILFNNRLKINDLSDQSSLPFRQQNYDHVLVYNGEITNFKELIKKYHLKEKYNFNENSDTQALYFLYQELGLGLLDVISGMFSFVIYDSVKNKIFLVRDRYGITPLFYLKHKHNLYFSSEMKLLYGLNCFSSELNRESLNHFFSLAYIPTTMTPFKQVHELNKSRYLTVDLARGEILNQQYYQLNYKVDESISEKDAINTSYELLRESVKNNLSADAEVGTTLSGGLDTSSIVGLAKDLGLSQNLRTYSIKMRDDTFDESKYQRLMSDFAGTKHTEILVGSRDVISNLHSAIAHLDEPNGDGAILPFFILAQNAQKDVKVLLSGEGGDEVFNAYETHGAYIYRRLYRKFVPKLIRSCFIKTAETLPVQHRKLSFEFLAKRFTHGAELDVCSSHIYWRHPLSDEEKFSIFKDNINKDATNQLFRDTYTSTETSEEINKVSALDLDHYLYGDLMVKSDRMFFAHSIEGRYPFLDKNLVNYLTTVPPKIKIRLLKRRNLQKKAMSKTLPKQILKRSNFGLEIPNSRWLNKDMEDLTRKYFTKQKIADSGLFNIENVESLIHQHKSKKRDLGRGLWCLLNFQIWFDMFVKNKNFKEYLVK